MRTDLESGAWVEYTPLQDLKGKHKRLLDRVTKPQMPAGAVDGDGRVDMDVILAGMDVSSLGRVRHDALWAAVITGWSYDFPVPEIEGDEIAHADSLDEIPLDDYEEIDGLLARHAEKLSRRPDPKVRAAATTTASSGSSRANGAHASRTA